MNKARRTDIERAVKLIEEAQAIVEEAASEEQEYHDNMPENMLDSEKAERAEEVATTLSEESDTLSFTIENLLDSIQ